jgi:formylglycine-generating enzyme
MTNSMRIRGYKKLIAVCLTLLLGTATGCGSQESSPAGRRADERSEALAEVTRLRAIVAQRPEDRESLVKLARYQWAAGDYDDAQRSFARALAMSSDRDTVLKFVGLLYRRGRFVAAASAWKRSGLIDDMDTEQQWLRDFLAVYEAGMRHRVAEGAGGTPVATPAAAGELQNSIGMSLLFVPGGRFDRGCDTCDADGRPVRSIAIDPLLFGRHEVTAGAYRLFMRETGRRREVEGDGFDQAPDDHPAFGVSWRDARAFTIWLSAREQAVYRLPTEAEWEFAARGGDAGYYNPWGSEPGQPRVSGNWGRTTPDDFHRRPPPTSRVGSFPKDRSPFGIFDMAGNVAEWCLDNYSASYYAWSPERNPLGPVEGGNDGQVLRGGAWNTHPSRVSLFAVIRSHAAFHQPYTGFGFRVVREILADSPNENVALADIDDVRRDGADLFVDYLTKRSSWDCEALAVEMPQVWNLAVNTRLKSVTAKNAVKHVFLSPQDPSGRSVGVTFTQDAAGTWAAAAPCAIRIPPQ